MLLASSLVHAADAPQDPVVTLERFEVTAASGITENVTKIPMMIDLVSPVKSAEAQPTWIGEVMNQLPGVFFAQLRGPTDAPSIRLPVSYDNTELFLQDGVPLQSPISFNHGAFGNSGALTSFGGMEVLKGPGTALHGSDAFAAVINVKSLEPTSTPTGTVRVSAGAFGHHEARGEVSDGFSAGQSYRLAVSDLHADEWRDNASWDRLQIIGRHRYKSEKTEVNTIVTFTDLDTKMAAGLSPAAFETNPRADGLAPNVPRDQASNPVKYFRVSSELTHALSPRFTVQLTPYYRDSDSSYMHTWEPAVVPITYERAKTAALISRFYANWNLGSQTVVGVDLDRTNLDQVDEQILPTQTVWGAVYPQGKHFDFTVNYRNIAPYIQHTQQVGTNLILVTGLRYEEARYEYDNHLSSGAQNAFYRPANRTDRFEAVNPKLGLTWEFKPGQSLFSRYAHGFRIPSAESLYTLDSSQTAFNLEPEQIDSYEVGYRGNLGQGLLFNLAGYYMKSFDGLTTGIATPAGTITANGGQREYRGVEGQIAARLSDEWRLTFSVAFQDSKILRDRPDGTDPRGVNGKTPNSQPSRLANLGLGWTPAFAGRRLSLDLETQLLGSWWIDDQNTLKTPDEVIFNLRARYALNRKWVVTAKALNLLDRHYAMTAVDEGFGVNYRPGNPLTVSGGLEYSW